MPRQEAQELDCLSVEPAASLGAEDDKAASSGAAEFGISSVTLAPGSSESAAQPGRVFARGWVSTRRVRGEHDCCVKGELGAVPRGETVGDDLDAPFISDGHVEVHVCRTLRATLASPSRQTRDGMLEGQRASTAPQR